MAMPAFLQSFIDGPKLPKVILGVAGLVAIGAGGYFLLWAPVQAEITKLDGKRQQLATELGTVRSQVAELARFQKEVAALQVKLNLLKAKLPTEKETPGLYRTLSEAAQGAGLGVSLFQPREPRPRDFVSEIPISITAEGGYHQLGQFLEKVAALERVVKVADLKIIGLTRAKSAVRIDLTLATFMYRDAAPAARPGGPAPAAPKPAASLSNKETRS
jgi:type IV pilus assembly protein PilO